MPTRQIQDYFLKKRPDMRFLISLFVLGSLILMPQSGQAAQDVTAGPVTGLPVPRYVSLKTERVNLREGPSKDHRTTWVFQRAGLPVEILAEFETWRRIRDAEGTEGWVLHSLLSGRRTALVTPWSKEAGSTIALREKADESAQLSASLQNGVIVSLRQCTGLWCRVTVARPNARDLSGFMRQDRLWGVYPNERLE
jgi:SH3-like domain-containing protein